ncbi:MAG: MBL fold metallo-hydrolase [Planctomycetes bacterium]|nr:MBL fold metallo-hydrolase [Planctomycetota bacterium]
MIGPRTFTFLGTGTSVGVPMLGCECPVCNSTHPRNQRYRSSVLIGTPTGNILIDTGPEMRLQLLREKVKAVHAVLYTHYHVDHLYGLDDLRMMSRHLNGPVPIFCSDEVEVVIRQVFSYAFNSEREIPIGFVPKIEFKRIDTAPFKVLEQTIVPIPLKHAWFNVFGFRIGDVAYCTDVSQIPETSWPLLEGVRILIIDALRYKPHPAHLSLEQALEIIERLGPEKAYLTHMSHEFDYEQLNHRLPAGVEMAHDGLSFVF